MLKRTARLAALSIIAAFLVVITAKQASANCGGEDNYWPTNGKLTSSRWEHNTYTARYDFRFSGSQLEQLGCIASYLEIDFHIQGFWTPIAWEGYSFQSNLPGAIHDTAALDVWDQIPGVTRIPVGRLGAGVGYYVSLSWSLPLLPGVQTPSFSVAFVPSYWATSGPEGAFCSRRPNVINGDAWCIFGTKLSGGISASIEYGENLTGLWEGRLSFSGYQQHAFGGWSDVVPGPPLPLYRGYVPDGMIVQNTSGSNLYSATGGRLFWFDQNNAPLREALLTQRRARYGEIPFLVMADEDIHAVEVNRTNTGAYAPGSHMPADNTFLYQYGTTQQYVIKYQHPFAVGDSNEVIALGGQDKAVMVPPGLADLQAHQAQWVQDDLLRFGTDPSVWHFVGQGYRVPSVPTRDCLSVRHNRGVTYMPASAWNYFPTHPTQQAACDFANDQWLFGAPSNRQMVVMYGAGYNVGSAEEVIALGGQNKAVPVADETVTGLLARTGSPPNDELVKSYNSPHVYHVVDNKLHYVGSPATRDCLSARSGKTVRTVPIDLIGRMQANGQTGANAYCELENRQLLAPNGVNVTYVQDGYKRPVTNPNIRNCIAVRAGAGQPVAVSDNVWNSYTAGPNAYCPYETEPGLNFVQEAGSPTVWLVGPGTGSTPGVKRHAGSLCVPDPYTTQLKEYHVWTVPAGETAGHVQGADWWADGPKCQALPKG